MEEVKIYVKAVVFVITVFILTAGGCCVHQDYRISKAIEQGNDPIMTRSAFENATRGEDRLIYIAIKAMSDSNEE